MSILNPFQLLELNVISAQDLAPVSRSMRTYAVAWVHPDRKLSTRVDTHGHTNPTWNDKFVFRVDEEFLHTDTSAVMIEIYALHWFKDVHVGTVRILVGNLIQTPPRGASSYHSHGANHYNQLGMRFVALQVRRASGRPQGILNIGVAILHSAMRSMPLYSQLSTSAVGYRELMGEEDPIHHHHSHHNNSGTPQSNSHVLGILKELRRTKSDTSSMIGSEMRAREFRKKGKKGKSSSMVNGSETGSKQRRSKGQSKGSSVISSNGGGGSEVGKNRKGKKGKASSLVNCNSEVVVDPPIHKKKGKIGKASSLINGSDSVMSVGPDPPKKCKSGKMSYIINGNSEVDEEEYFPPKKVVEVKPILKPFVATDALVPMASSPKVKPSPRFNLMDRGVGPYRATPRRQQGKSPFHHNKFQSPYEYGTPRKSTLMGGGGMAFLTESELGPSPSEVAAALAKQPADETESSMVGGWSVDESVEGLRSKLERWRTELPPVYDRGELSSYPSSESRHNRRHTDGGNGLFSCFSNICGVECSIVCGSGSVSGSKKSSSERIIRSPSADNLNYK